MYPRRSNTKRSGTAFSPEEIIQVWIKGREVPGYSLAEWRYDSCGAPIRLNDYGNTSSKFGWEVDHVTAVANGGTDDLWNLQPLQWQNNREKSDKVYWSCAIPMGAR